MKNKTIFIFILAIFMPLSHTAQARNTPLPVNEPIVSNIGATTAQVSVAPLMLNTLSQEQKSGLYFEYIQSNMVCIAIYPVPENCLPKKTIKGQTSTILKDLKQNTSYTVVYKIDNTIACITTPCPSNELKSGSVEFRTTGITTNNFAFNSNLKYRSQGFDVTMLQDVLRSQGFLATKSTGYFGIATFKAVKLFQKNYMRIAPTGYVGLRTRLVLNTLPAPSNTEEYFSGTIQSVSTACFSDGECSVTIDGKKIVTTIGWSQAIVGSIKGSVNSIGDIETSKIGTRANVYAQKTADGYTLYGNSNYYIEVL
jgi:peptidoglycan hydrolase-like protein with peptidoglycan-binding domain